MITIKHNFDETKFKWLWARYVKAGNIEKHCVNSIPGAYSKKFSGASNRDLLTQPTLIMDEVPEGQYEAIYFCGVLKKGYLNKNPEKNNYAHNVHFAVRPQKGGNDVWDFENWHVEIEGGVLEHIPATYELGDKFFQEPYTPHYYTCRIFRWMVGHFYPQELRDLKFGLPETITFLGIDNSTFSSESIVELYIKHGYECAEYYFNENEGDGNSCVWQNMIEDTSFSYASDEECRNTILRKQLFNRHSFFMNCQVMDWMILDTDMSVKDTNGVLQYIHLSNVDDDTPISFQMACNLFRIGVNEFLDMVSPYQERDMYFDPRVDYECNMNKKISYKQIHNGRIE